jgi:aminoglycoside phosphotransferase (APT) family kinase protein
MPGPGKVWRRWHDLRKDTELALPGRMTRSEIERISRWWDQFLADQRMQEYQPAIRHGDLWYGNLLIRPDGAISAVLDWEVVAIADPAQDLALTRYLGPSFTQAVLDAYRGRGGTYDREIQYRIERHWELRELTGIPLAVSVGDEDELSECISKLRAGPIFR